MFDFLTPVFAAAGIVTATIPIVLHLLRRTPSEKLPFSLVRFLRPSLPKMTKRSTIEHWPLMLLRILALVLIGMAFARPFQRLAMPDTVVDESRNRVVLLIDSSASMRRDGIRDAVAKQIQQTVDELNSQDVLSISCFSRTTRTVVSADQWSQTEPDARRSLVEKMIESWEPDWMETRTGAALLSAADEVSQENVRDGQIGQRRIVLITDFQRGSQLDELRTASFPAAVQVDLKIVRPLQSGNAGISLMEDDAQGQTRIRLTSSTDSQLSDFTLQLVDKDGRPTGKPITADVAPGQRRAISLPVSQEPGVAPAVAVELMQDIHPFDNIAELPLTENPAVRIAHVGPSDLNNAELMRYYLQRVVDGNESEPVDIVDVSQGNGVILPIADDIRLIVVTDVVPAGLLESIQNCLKRGGVLLVALRSPEVAGSIASLLPEPLTVEEATVSDYVMLGNVDFTSPLFAPFSDARFSDFSSIRFWHYRMLKTQADSTVYRAAARFDTGTPAILETRESPAGHILLFASGWHPEDSQWALSTRFPPMITSLIRKSNPRRGSQLTAIVGELISPGELLGTEDWSIQKPDRTIITAGDVPVTTNDVTPHVGNSPEPENPPATGSSDVSDSGSSEGTESELSRSARAPQTSMGILLDQPGRYVLSGKTSESDRILDMIAGLSPSETRTDPLPVGQLQALGLQAAVADEVLSEASSEDADLAGQLNSMELESRQKFWRWLLIAGLGCLLLEALIAGGIERRQQMESIA